MRLNISDTKNIKKLFEDHHFDTVINLAAQAGVRYSIENPQAYIDANVKGFCNILEGSRYAKVEHLVFASTSSVYGANTNQPFSEHQSTDHPLAIYAATKKANELMAHSYAQLFDLPCTGTRFFTVYGPWGRPDMALFKFTKNILSNTPIDLYNHGDMVRDFTYIDDIVDGIIKIHDRPATPNPNWDPNKPDPATSYAPYRLYNIGNNNPVQLMDFVNALEEKLGKKAKYNMLPIQDGDVSRTCADCSLLEKDFNFKPTIDIRTGISNFLDWYLSYYTHSE